MDQQRNDAATIYAVKHFLNCSTCDLIPNTLKLTTQNGRGAPHVTRNKIFLMRYYRHKAQACLQYCSSFIQTHWLAHTCINARYSTVPSHISQICLLMDTHAHNTHLICSLYCCKWYWQKTLLHFYICVCLDFPISDLILNMGHFTSPTTWSRISFQ
jgi:hypothetical protein